MNLSRRTMRMAAAAAILLPSFASAQTLQYVAPLSGTTGGLGTVLTVLTLNNTNNVSSGCVTPTGAGTLATCGYLNNTVQASSQVRFLSELGGSFSTLGTDLRVIANFAEPQNSADNGATVDALSLYLYGPSGVPLYTAALTTDVIFATTNPGVGNIGFGFGLTPTGATAFQSFLNTALAGGGTANNLSIGLGASLLDVQGGLDTFSLTRLNVAATVVPEPSSYVLMMAGLVGIAVFARRRRHV